jgi:Asp-tRNA(Asn)/Glu-tRNA(Gln) amidotransferase A subunit family amidase
MIVATDPADLGVLEASRLVRARQLSAVELVEACLRRIDAVSEPSFDAAPDAVNAWVRTYPELARRQATDADQQFAKDDASTPLLCGIPTALRTSTRSRGCQ